MQKYGANEKTQKTIQADTLIGNNQVVKKVGIAYTVLRIQNRTRNALCPIKSTVMDTDDVGTAFEI